MNKSVYVTAIYLVSLSLYGCIQTKKGVWLFCRLHGKRLGTR